MKVGSALDLAAVIKGRRKDLHMTQRSLAEQAGVTRSWLAMVEGGKASVEFGLILRVLDVLDLRIDVSPFPTNLSDTYKSVPNSPPRNLSDDFKGPRVDLDDLLDRQRRP